MSYQHVYANDIEIEYRVGKMNGRFVPQLSKEEYIAVVRELEAYDAWDVVETENTVDTFYVDGVRSSSNGAIIKKKIVQTTPYTLGKWTIRLAVSREIPHTVECSEIQYIRSKQRTRYIKDFYSIDISVINNDTYELEVELWNREYIKNHTFHFIHNHVMQVLQNIISSANI